MGAAGNNREISMAQQDRNATRLSDISHLFLSSVRQRQTQGAPAPVRKPPTARAAVSIDLTPEEFAHVLSTDSADAQAITELAPVQAVIGPHLGNDQMQRVEQLARHMAADGSRVGVVIVDVCEFQLLCYDRQSPLPAQLVDPISSEYFEPGELGDAMEELNVDIDQWLLVVLNPRLPEARSVLRCADHWTFLSTCDHDTIVACYRTLKGLSGMHDAEWALAVLDAPSEADAFRVYTKLAGCCRQFLGTSLESHIPVRPSDQVSQHTVFAWRSTHDKASVSAGAHWQVVTEFFRRARNADADMESSEHENAPVQAAESPEPAIATAHVEMNPPAVAPAIKRTFVPAPILLDKHESQPIAAVPVRTEREMPAARETSKPLPAVEPAKPIAITVETDHPEAASAAQIGTVGDVVVKAAEPGRTMQLNVNDHSPASAKSAEDSADMDVIELPSATANPQTILDAVLDHAGSNLVQCPVRPPMCPEARLAVTRDHRLTLLAVAGDGLSDLRSIGQAYRWLNENRSLVAMAVPQLSIDAHQLPHLRLLVSRVDLSAEILQPMLQSSCVTVESYRKLRWGTRSGLVLEAA